MHQRTLPTAILTTLMTAPWATVENNLELNMVKTLEMSVEFLYSATLSIHSSPVTTMRSTTVLQEPRNCQIRSLCSSSWSNCPQPGGVFGAIVKLKTKLWNWVGWHHFYPFTFINSPAVSAKHHHTTSFMFHSACRDHLFTFSRHSGWNKMFQVWTNQTKGLISTGLMSIPCLSCFLIAIWL